MPPEEKIAKWKTDRSRWGYETDIRKYPNMPSRAFLRHLIKPGLVVRDDDLFVDAITDFLGTKRARMNVKYIKTIIGRNDGAQLPYSGDIIPNGFETIRLVSDFKRNAPLILLLQAVKKKYQQQETGDTNKGNGTTMPVYCMIDFRCFLEGQTKTNAVSNRRYQGYNVYPKFTPDTYNSYVYGHAAAN